MSIANNPRDYLIPGNLSHSFSAMNNYDLTLEKENFPNIKSLPLDLLKHIFSLVGAKYAKDLLLTCKYFCVIGTRFRVFDDKTIIEDRYLTAIQDNLVGGVERFLTNYNSYIQDLDELKFLRSKSFILAVKKNHYHVVKMLSEKQKIPVEYRQQSDALQEACINGHFEMVNLLLTSNQLVLSDNLMDLRFACSGGHLKIVKLLLDYYESKKSVVYGDYPLLEACENKHLEIVDLLLSHPVINPKSFSYKSLQSAIESNALNIVDSLMKKRNYIESISPHYWIILYQTAIAFKRHEIIKLLLSDEIAGTKSCYSYIEVYADKAVEADNIEALKLFLNVKPQELSTNICNTLLKAIRNQNYDIIKLLFEKTGLKILDKTNLIASLAHESYAEKEIFLTELFKMLLSEDLFNVKDSTLTLEFVTRYGYTKVFTLLFSDTKKNIAEKDIQRAFFHSCSYGHAEIVRFLILDDRIDLAASDNIAFRYACERGRIEVVKILLKESKVNPNDADDYAFKNACSKRHIEIVRLLLDDKRFYNSNDYDSMIEWAFENGYIDVLELLLSGKCTDTISDLHAVLRQAINYGSVNVVKKLHTDPRVNLDVCFRTLLANVTNLGAEEVIKSFLIENHLALQMSIVLALHKGIEYIKLVLKDKRIILSDKESEIIQHTDQSEDVYLDHMHQVLFEQLINDTTLTSDVCDEVLAWTSRRGNVEFVRRLLAHPKVDFLDLAFGEACKGGHVEIVRLLIEKGCKFHFYNMEAAIKYGNLKVVKEFYNYKKLHKDCIENIIAADKFGHTEILKFLLSFEKNNPVIVDNQIFEIACKVGVVETVQTLLKSSAIDCLNGNPALQQACQHGHIDIVKLLLADTRFCLFPEEGLKKACQYGHVEIVKLLLSKDDHKLIPENMSALQRAIENGRTNIVELLLNDDRLDFQREIENSALNIACGLGYAEIVKFFLTDKRLRISGKSIAPLEAAIINKHEAVVKLILDDDRIDPSEFRNFAIQRAAVKGNCKIVEMLLADRRVYPCAKNNEAIRLACVCGQIDIVRVLLQDPRINLTINREELLKQTTRKDIIDLLNEK